MHWKKVALIGVGLLGGSLGMAMRQQKLALEVTGFVRRRGAMSECRKAGAADRTTMDLEKAVSGADLVVFCTPLGQMKGLCRQLIPFLQRDVIVTDVGSVKGTVIRDLEPMIRRAGGRFVGSHPMAGSEKTGVGAARGGLYRGSVCVVTPTSRTDEDALERIEALWSNVGARVLRLAPEEHDALVSRSSHLPHMTAACLVNLVLGAGGTKEQAAVCANGFRDTTRVASGSPEMWKDIGCANARNIAAALRSYIAELEKLARLLEKRDSAGLKTFLELSKDLRDGWLRRQVSSSSPE